MERRIGWIAVVMSAVGLVLSFLPLPRWVNVALQGVECRIGDAQYLDEVTVTVCGTYKQYLFRQDTFSGNIRVDKYDVKNAVSAKLTDPIRFHEGYAYLDYAVMDEDAMLSLDTLGFVAAPPDFSRLLIGVFELDEEGTQGGDMDVMDIAFDAALDADVETDGPSVSKSWDGGDGGLFIAAPATDRVQAGEIAKSVATQSQWLSAAHWE